LKEQIARLFQTLSHGVYVIGVGQDDRCNAFTAAWVMQVSFKPCLLALSINPKHSSYQIIQNKPFFSVNVLSQKQLHLATHFAKPASANKLTAENWRCNSIGVPLIKDALACFECEVLADYDAGDHRLLIGRVFAGELMDEQDVPMAYRDTGALDGAVDLFPNSLQ